MLDCNFNILNKALHGESKTNSSQQLYGEDVSEGHWSGPAKQLSLGTGFQTNMHAKESIKLQENCFIQKTEYQFEK